MPVRVECSARLHLGIIDMHGGLGHKFGSIGVAIEQPRLVVEATPADSLVAHGPDRERAAAYGRKFYAHCAPVLQEESWGSSDRPGLKGGTLQAELRVEETIPAHVGLGSGTQLALAVGSALAQLHGVTANVSELATVMGRGRRSGIGIGAFRAGGFVVDGGCKNGNPGQEPPLLFRQPVPPDWHFVIVTPEVDQGLSGEREDRAFDALPVPSHEAVGKICRLLVMKMLPALVEKDIVEFGAALTEIQCQVGDVFVQMQSGRFANPLSADLVAFLLAQGALGAGQSSWGPTVYGLLQGKDAAMALEHKVNEFLHGKGEATVFHSRASNQGARVFVTPA